MKVVISAITLSLLGVAFAQECDVYVADSSDIIVMDAEQRGPGGGWEFRSELGGYGGSGYLVYKPHSNFGGTEPKPQNMADERIKSYFFKVNTPGIYRVVMRSAAPHGTEHNDLWMSLPESGALKRRFDRNSDLTSPIDPNTNWLQHVDSSNWFKVYQNRGGLVWNDGGRTVDHMGHVVLTKPLRADGTWYSVRVGGRSTQFNLDRIALYRCEDEQCNDGSERFQAATEFFGPFQSQCENGAPDVTVQII